MQLFAEKAFTLIEVLVVLIIISIITSVAVLSIHLGGVEQRLDNDALQLKLLLKLANDQAILEATQIGLMMDHNQYRFVRYSYQQNSDNNPWQDIGSGPLATRYRIGSDIRITLTPTSQDDGSPQIIFYSTGEITPFTIELTPVQGKVKYTVTGTFGGDIITQETH